MADADGPDEPDGRDARERDEDGTRRNSKRSGGLRFWLPPIELPSTAFPSDLQITLPAPKSVHRHGVSTRSVVVVALGFDLLDAWLALAGVGPILDWTRVVGGLGLAALLSGIHGSLYAWEAVAVALGVGWVSAVPSLTALLLVRGSDE